MGDEEFPPEEAAPCQQERWERVAWPCRSGTPSCPRGAPCPSVWVNQNLLFVNRACLSLGAACPSSLPMALPVPVPSQARQVPCKPHAPQLLSVARRALCPALALLLAPWGRPPATALARSSLGLQHHPALPLQACHPWAAVGLWAALPAVPGGWGQRGGQEHPPGGRGLKGGVEEHTTHYQTWL